MILSNGRREENTCLKPTWTKLEGKKEDIIGEFTNDEMEQYVWKLYMYDKVMPMYDIEY